MNLNKQGLIAIILGMFSMWGIVFSIGHYIRYSDNSYLMLLIANIISLFYWIFMGVNKGFDE